MSKISKEQFKDLYYNYLKSKDWAEKRHEVIIREGGLCQACRKGRAVQAHHSTYRHIFHEPLFDLIAVCVSCHKKIHEEFSIETVIDEYKALGLVRTQGRDIGRAVEYLYGDMVAVDIGGRVVPMMTDEIEFIEDEIE